jgi:hypothetical protein
VLVVQRPSQKIPVVGAGTGIDASEVRVTAARNSRFRILFILRLLSDDQASRQKPDTLKRAREGLERA